MDAVIVRTYGATEVYPPEDADMIIDNTSTGETLRKQNLEIVDTVLRSSTRMLAWPGIRKAHPARWERIQHLVSLLKGVQLARRKVLLEMNIPKSDLEKVLAILPAMRSPTVSPLHGEEGYAVKIAVDREEIRTLVPQIQALGACDILQYQLEMIIP